MKSIAVIGAGFVGGSLATVVSENPDYVVYNYDKSGKIASGATFPITKTVKAPKSLADFVERCETQVETEFNNVYFVCVPTPMKRDGSVDISIVKSIIDELAEVPGQRIAVVKSTVPPGTCRMLNSLHNNVRVIFCPEFLTEANAINDMRNQNRIVIGGKGGKGTEFTRVTIDFFQEVFPYAKIVKTTWETAELVKYVTNTFLAMKVSFANEIFQIVQSLNCKTMINDDDSFIDYESLIQIATLDERLGRSHWQVPGPMLADDGSGRKLFGYAGSCLCKDINGLITLAKSLDVKPTMLSASWEKNLEVRPERDWENLKGRAVSEEPKKEENE